MISIPVAVHNDLFQWQLNLFWFNHQLTYGHAAAEKATAAVVARNRSTDRPFAEMEWDLSVLHRIVQPYFELLPDVQESGLALPLNLQTAVCQVIETMDDSEIVEILDCDMCHIRPAPHVLPDRGEVIVNAIYELWHLHSLGEHRQIVQSRTHGVSERYNGGFVPIIGRVDTLRQLLPAWVAAHLDMLNDTQLTNLQKWWAGMYALQVACENLDIQMTHQDILYVPGVNALSLHHYVVHYSCDPRFDKKRFPDVSCLDFEDNVFYSRVKDWMSLMR